MDKNKIIISALAVLVGILMIVSPEVFFKMGVIILGLAAAIDGIFVLVTTRNLIVDPQFRLMMSIRGFTSLVIGVLAVIFPLVIASSLMKIVAWVFGGYLLISAALQCYSISKLHRNGIMVRQAVIEAFITVAFAVVLFILPVQSAMNLIIRCLGIVILLSGLMILFFLWRNRPVAVTPDSVDDVEPEVNPDLIEGKVVESEEV